MDFNNVLITVGVLAGIGGALALLMSVAQSTIGNFGEQTITVNNEKKLTMDGGDTLLAGLIDNEVFIPSACGGKGSCGYCKCNVTSGGGQFLPTERGYVTPEEEKEGVRLACQVKVKEDIAIEIPEEYLSLKQYDAIVTKITDVTDKIKHIFLKLPEGEEMEFKAGQYVQLLAPEYPGNDEEVYRAYSIASTPTKKDEIELFIGYIPEGIATTYVHQHLKEGQTVQIIGPFGHFFYQPGDREMVLAGIGTGMAPIMSILRYMRDNNITDRKATFYISARTEKDFYLMDELQEIKEKLPNVNYVFSLTRGDDTWKGEVGRVTDTIPRLAGDLSNAEAYLCGSPVMIDGVVESLKEKGMPEENIFYDKFE